MGRLAVDGTNVYGVSKTGVYRLGSDSGSWNQIAPEIPGMVTSFAVEGNILYVGTRDSGVLHFKLDE